jgi:Flp pilus assembly secretin CpaC
MQTEKVEAPPPTEKKSVRIQVGGVVTFVVEAVATTADDPSLVRVFGQPESIAVVGKKIGKTTLHVQKKKEGTEDVDVEVVAGEPSTRALAVGETHPISMKGVKEYSVGLPDIVSTTTTTDGTQLLVTGKKQGTTTILMIGRDGKNRSHEIVVVGGDRHL